MNDERTPGAEAEETPGPVTAGPEAPQSAEAPADPAAALRSELEEALKSAALYKDQFLRKAAEFENYKRRAESDYLSMVRSANESLITALLPIVEDFTRSLKSGTGGADGEAFSRGVELIFQKLMKVLEAQGLAPFDSRGKPFDVDYHDALLQVVREDVPPGTVVEEISRGYTLNDRVLRHAKVIVSAAPQGESAPGGSTIQGTPAPRGESKESTRD